MYKHLVPVIYLITNHPLYSQETRPPSPKRPPSPPVPKARPLVSQSATPTGPIEIRRDYNPKTHGPSKPVTEKAPTEGQFLISPITGEKIPAHKMQEHMRYSERPISVYRIAGIFRGYKCLRFSLIKHLPRTFIPTNLISHAYCRNVHVEFSSSFKLPF